MLDLWEGKYCARQGVAGLVHKNLFFSRTHLITLGTNLTTYNMKLLVLIMEIQRVYFEVELYFIYFLNTFQASNAQVLQPCSANPLIFLC